MIVWDLMVNTAEVNVDIDVENPWFPYYLPRNPIILYSI